MKRKLITSFILLISPIFAFSKEMSIDEKIESGFKPFADWIGHKVFYPISIAGIDVPIVLIVLLSGALFFTLYFKFANIRLLGVAINAAKGKYDDVDHHTVDVVAGDPTPGGDVFESIQHEGVVGEVTHFQALTAALSATVGLGNIAGVAVAIAIGGPGGIGKSSFCKKLAKNLPDSNILRLDDYKTAREVRKGQNLFGAHPDANMMDLVEEHYLSAKNGRSFDKPLYNAVSGEADETEFYETKRFTIIDGEISTYKQFRDYVDFGCCDVGPDPIMVVFRVYDKSGNYNECMVEVQVQDNIPDCAKSSKGP